MGRDRIRFGPDYRVFKHKSCLKSTSVDSENLQVEQPNIEQICRGRLVPLPTHPYEHRRHLRSGAEIQILSFRIRSLKVLRDRFFGQQCEQEWAKSCSANWEGLGRFHWNSDTIQRDVSKRKPKFDRHPWNVHITKSQGFLKVSSRISSLHHWLCNWLANMGDPACNVA